MCQLMSLLPLFFRSVPFHSQAVSFQLLHPLLLPLHLPCRQPVLSVSRKGVRANKLRLHGPRSFCAKFLRLRPRQRRRNSMTPSIKQRCCRCLWWHGCWRIEPLTDAPIYWYDPNSDIPPPQYNTKLKVNIIGTFNFGGRGAH